MKFKDCKLDNSEIGLIIKIIEVLIILSIVGLTFGTWKIIELIIWLLNYPKIF